MFEWNAQQVKKLTFYEIWMMLVGRALIGFGGGAYLEKYFPRMIDPVAIPILTLGVVLTLIAGKGYFRKTSPDILARKSVTKHTWPYPILYKAVTFNEPNVAQEGRELIAA